jgi:hypothetical protein
LEEPTGSWGFWTWGFWTNWGPQTQETTFIIFFGVLPPVYIGLCAGETHNPYTSGENNREEKLVPSCHRTRKQQPNKSESLLTINTLFQKSTRDKKKNH